ncbi:hypothetical protein [Sphingomicrobium nitratireducens]|uniref:hypothetical protein n=1 Tax=Sphingomicrobium nitratireducens TaxID=2964666 RepID=UPI0022403948|nr:hypothetical protein [Sphingomicrobium nitratireducens]
MRYLSLIAGAAALAVTAPLAAQGHGNKDKDRGGHQDRGGHGKEKSHKAKKADRVRVSHDSESRGRAKVEKERGRSYARAERGDRVFVVDKPGRRQAPSVSARRVKADVRVDRHPSAKWRYGASGLGTAASCPPGLVPMSYGCMPPGQAKKMWGQQIPQSYADRRLVGPYAAWFDEDDDGFRYRMGDDYIYRIASDGIVRGLIPLYDRPGYYYPVGTRYPQAYDFYNVPMQYRTYYSDPYYRYGDGAIYRVDPETQLIRSVVALLAGDLAVGQPMPNAYSVYNVPLTYRSTYYDTPDNWYRYNDGYIYRVDPTTMLVTELVKAII